MASMVAALTSSLFHVLSKFRRSAVAALSDCLLSLDGWNWKTEVERSDVIIPIFARTGIGIGIIVMINPIPESPPAQELSFPYSYYVYEK